MHILIKNTDVVNWNETISNVDVSIKDGLIEYVKKSQDRDERGYDSVIDAKGKIVVPGLVNSHTHAGMTLLRNFAADIPLEEWLFNRIFLVEARLTNEDIYWGTMLGVAEMIKSGTTTFADMYYHMDDVARIVEKTGIRANLCKSVLSLNKEGVGSISKDIDGAYRYFNEWNGRGNGRIKVYIEIHSAYIYDKESLCEAAKIARDLHTGIHIHVAETKKEQDVCYSKYGMDAVNILNECGIFDVPVIAAHCVHLSDENIELLRKKGVNVSHNITSNLKLGSGIARVVDMNKEGINISLGTDGCASNDNLNMFEEMHLAALVHKGLKCDPTVIKACDVVKMATLNGAQALGFEKLGIIKEGNIADVIIIDVDGIHNTPRGDYDLGLVYSTQAQDVDTVIVDGKILMKNKQLLTIDEEMVKYKVREIRKRLSVY